MTQMSYGLRKGLEDISFELRSIRNVLYSLWSARYNTGETDQLNPDAFADEYISTEECARRLNVSDQTIRNWILLGKRKPEQGWIQGIHYVNLTREMGKKPIIRIPWNKLIMSFTKNNPTDETMFWSKTLYKKENDLESVKRYTGSEVHK
jgi:hypothetical protein